MEKEQWYSNKDLFEMLEGFKQEVAELRLEMRETKTLIRDYNGLRENVNEASERINKIEEKINTQSSSRTEYIGYIIAVISIIFLFLNYLKG